MRVHGSWFIGWSCLGFLIGAALCAVIRSGTLTHIWVAIAASILIISCLLSGKRWALLPVCIAGCVLGLWRGNILQLDLEGYQPFYGSVVTVSGLVSQDPSVGQKGDQRLNLTQVQVNSINLKGTVWISVGKADIKRGDRITVTGKLGEGFGSLAAIMYQAKITEVVRPYPGDIARRVRDRFATGVRQAIPAVQASLGLGYLVGQKTALPAELEADIKATGLTHAVVASGYNLTILVVFCRRLFLRVSKYVATVSSSVMVIAFMFVTGFSPSMSRAGLVALLGLLVWYYGRAMHPFVLLSFAAAATVYIQPSYILGDLGWYLSFTAFIGVIVLSPLIHHYFWGINKPPGLVRDLIVSTLSAQIVTTPVILYSFGLFATYALPANALVLPLVPLAMLGTFIVGIGSLIMPFWATIFGFPATILLTYSTVVIQYFAKLPSSQIEVSFNTELMIASYIGIATIIVFLKRRTKHDFRDGNQVNDTY